MQEKNAKWYFTWWGIVIIITATLVLILLTAFAFSVIDAAKKIKNSQSNSFTPQPYTEETRKLIEGEGNYWTGSANPKITIVEFADFTCPHCANSYGNIREIGLKHKNDVKIIYRNFAVADNSQVMAMAAQCAGEQGLFWLMHDKLFQNQAITSDATMSPEAQLSALANRIGANATKFSSCLSSKKYLAKIQKDLLDADQLGVTGTPTWFINGNKVEGDMPYELFVQIVEKLIAK